MAVEGSELAEAALRRDVVSAMIIKRAPVSYDPYLSGRTVERVSGLAAELWLEDLCDEYGGQWPITRFGAAARHIATWDADTNSNSQPRVGFDSEDAWAERHGQPHRLADAVATLRSLRNAPGAQEAMRSRRRGDMSEVLPIMAVLA